MSIPKVIHYCWFGGGKLDELSQRCIESWKEKLPDYEIKEWNESNFDIKINKFVNEAYEKKYWAFVSDYARLWVVYNYGGIYLDTDVEMLKSFSPLLQEKAFIGLEHGTMASTGLGFGAEKGNLLIKELMEYYDDKSFVNQDGSLNTLACPRIITDILIEKGLKQNNTMQVIEGMKIFPKDFFAPMEFSGKLTITKNTYSIHHYAASWFDENGKKQLERERKLARIFGGAIEQKDNRNRLDN